MMNTEQRNSMTTPTALSQADLEQAQGGLIWLIPVAIAAATLVEACNEAERKAREEKGNKQ